MSYIPTEKIHLSKKQVLPINASQINNNHSNLSANFNPNIFNNSVAVYIGI